MYFVLQGANFSKANLGQIEIELGSIGTGGTIDPNAKYTLTVNVNVEGATIKLTPEGGSTTTTNGTSGTIEVTYGTKVSIEVSKEDYNSYNRELTITRNRELSVELTPITSTGGDMDADATAFISAASITDTAMQTKLDTLVKSLKSNNLWNKIDALYPCVGSTFESMSYNLKDTSKYKLTAASAPQVTANVGFYSTAKVYSTYNSSRTGTDFHTLGVSGTKVKDCGTGLVSVGASSLAGYDGNGKTNNKGVLMYYNNTKLSIRTATDNNWLAESSSTIPEHGLMIGSLSSGIVYNGENMNATKTGTLNLTSYPDSFYHNGFRTSTDKTQMSNPFQVRLSGFGAALTIAEMQKYSEILNAFKNIY